MNYVIAFICLSIGFVLMSLALHFCQYKRRTGCCAGGFNKLIRDVDGCQNPTGDPADCPCHSKS